MEPGPDQGAKATWPHEQMTVENIVSIGDTWFEQLRTLMNTYLSGSAVHVFGKRSGIATSQQPFGPYHRRDQFKSPVARARYQRRALPRRNTDHRRRSHAPRHRHDEPAHVERCFLLAPGHDQQGPRTYTLSNNVTRPHHMSPAPHTAHHAKQVAASRSLAFGKHFTVPATEITALGNGFATYTE